MEKVVKNCKKEITKKNKINVEKKIKENKSCKKNVLPKQIENINTILTNEENTKKKILFVASESQPFCATGGLADAIGSLPKYLQKNSDKYDVRVIIPLYSDIKDCYRDNFSFLGNCDIKLSWRSLYCGVFSYKINDIVFYFIDNEYYFKRSGGIYSYFDDGERFAFFSNAVLDTFEITNFKPDIILCSDWQTALIPILLRTTHLNNDYYKSIKSIFLLHNSEYQGKFDMKIIEDVFAIEKKYSKIVEHDKCLNLVKGAITCCDKFLTVSKSYMEEIKNSEFGNGLNSVIKNLSFKSFGILNGIDNDFYNPKTDKNIYENYDINSWKEGKTKNKLSLQKELGLPIDENVPIISVVSRITKHKGFDLIKEKMEEIVCKNIQFVMVGSCDREYEDYFNYLQGKYPNKVKINYGYSNVLARKIYSASDLFIMPSKSEPCGLSQMIASRYGVVPIVREVGGLKDSIKDFGCVGGGNGYTFMNFDGNDFVYSVNRALEDYNNKNIWEERVETVMKKDFSWDNSSMEYIGIFNELLGL